MENPMFKKNPAKEQAWKKEPTTSEEIDQKRMLLSKKWKTLRKNS